MQLLSGAVDTYAVIVAVTPTAVGGTSSDQYGSAVPQLYPRGQIFSSLVPEVYIYIYISLYRHI